MNDENTRPLSTHDEPDEPTSVLGPEPEATEPATEPIEGLGHEGHHGSVEQGNQLWAPHVDDDTGGRHPLGVAHLVTGLVFLGIATSWLLRETGVVGSDGTQWFLPLILVVAGAVGLLAWLSSARGKSR